MTSNSVVASLLLPKLLVLLLLVPNSLAQEESEGQRLIKLADWKIEAFESYLAIIGALICVALFKAFYPRIPYVAEYIPQSLILIIAGVAIAATLKASNFNFEKSIMNLTPELFFNFLLPPIVLDASYNLSNRTFGDFLGSIVIYAFLGTLMNFFIIGPFMYGLDLSGAMESGLIEISLSNYFLFAALIVAVDPVAVLAIFQEIGVNLGLYFTVFGESLLNDAVTVVLYEIMREFASATSVSIDEVGFGIVSFFTISLGGVAVGWVMGIVSCILTRWETHLASILLFLLALFTYFITNCIGWSGIIAMICCGLMQSGYAFHNVSTELITALQEMTRQLAELSEALIFLLLGFQIVTTPLQWSTGFCLWAFVVCTMARSISVLLLSQMVNWLKINNMRIGYREQIIMIYGGLRGAVASSLAFLLKDLEEVDEKVKKIIITCTLFIIGVTVGFQGLTMKPLVQIIQIKLEQKQTLSVLTDLSCRVIDHTLAGVESIIGSVGRNSFRQTIARIDFELIRPILQRNPERHDDKVVRTYEQIALNLHWATVKPELSGEYLKDLPQTLVNRFLSGDIAGSRRYRGKDEEPSLFDVITDVPPKRRESRSLIRRRKSSSYLEEERPEWIRPTSMISEKPKNRDRQYKERYLTVMRRKSSDYTTSELTDLPRLRQMRRFSYQTDMSNDSYTDNQSHNEYTR